MTKQTIENTSAPVAEEKQRGFYCKTCKRNHAGKLDGPGYGHWPFPETTILKTTLRNKDGSFALDERGRVVHKSEVVVSKPQKMYDLLLEQPKKPLFIPIEVNEKPGALAFCQLNGLRIGIYKNAYVDLPEQIADTMRDSLNQTARVPFDAKTAPNPFTGIENPANLKMRSDAATKEALGIAQ